jgi:peptidyl-prolyl cis-trans isomerase A (cyclophilin A)
MLRIARIILIATCCGFCLQAVAQQTEVRIATTLGDVVVAVDSVHAPNTAANFLRYVDQKFYDGGAFHRTVTLGNQPNNAIKIEVIQGEINPAQQPHEFAPIALERTNQTGLRHLAGVISMARDGPDSATSDFFICVTAQPSLDFGGQRNPDGQGFAAFGRVVMGMGTIRRIQRSKAAGQKLTPPVEILSIRRVLGH